MKWERNPLSRDHGRLALIASVSATTAYGLTRIYSSQVNLPEAAASIPTWGVFFGCSWASRGCSPGGQGARGRDYSASPAVPCDQSGMFSMAFG
jgi:hypothetical protein